MIESDAQAYTLSRTNRLDRRNVKLSGQGSIDSGGGFVLGLHVNLGERIDPFQVGVDAAKYTDFDVSEPFRKSAHYCLSDDEAKAGERWDGNSASTTGSNFLPKLSRSTPTRHHARTSRTLSSTCTATPSANCRPQGKGCRCTNRTWTEGDSGDSWQSSPNFHPELGCRCASRFNNLPTRHPELCMR